MAALRTVRGTSTALYPFTQIFTCHTGISDSQAAVPSRWVKSPPLVRFEFSYNPIRQADKNNLKSDFNSAKGQLTGGGGSAGLTATTDIAYTDLGFDSDEFSAVEQVSTQYGVKWTLTQQLPQNLSPGSSGAAYPTLSVSGKMSMLPYTQKLRFQTIASQMAAGPKYTYAEFGAGGLFPSGGLMSWTLDEQLVDTDVNAKVAHFLNNWGDCFPFQFTDEDGTTYSNVYYASPVLTIQRTQYNTSKIVTNLVQLN